MTKIGSYWRRITGREEQEESAPMEAGSEVNLSPAMFDVDIAPNDPLLMFFQNSPGVVDIDTLLISSPGLTALKENGVKLVVPLVSQGELIGLINLGPRLSEQEYSADDRKLLNDLATQAAPAVRVAQLAREQQAEARERERMEQELRVARLIQQTLLPKELPQLELFDVSAYYQPAREVGGDFYDFLTFEDGRVGIIVGDVTDKGVPAALVMATTRTLLRAAAERIETPGEVLERVNNLLYPDIPEKMFVTCLYALLDPANGRLQYANAGHDLPYRRLKDGVDELRAVGMPLGLMPDMTYEEKEVTLESGQTILLHSDGLAEAHNPQGEMFGFPRLQELMAGHPGGASLMDFLLEKLEEFTGPDWEQEDDVTLVTLEFLRDKKSVKQANNQTAEREAMNNLARFSLPSQPGNEREAMKEVEAAVQDMNLGDSRLEKLKTAVAEATMNAMEHGSKYNPDLPVEIEVLASGDVVAVRITDHGGGAPIPETDEAPNLEAKLAGQQSPRGWGLFLIENMVDEMNISSDDSHHTIELIMNLKGGE